MTQFEIIAKNVKPGNGLKTIGIGRSVLDEWRRQGLVCFTNELPNWVTLTKYGYETLSREG